MFFRVARWLAVTVVAFAAADANHASAQAVRPELAFVPQDSFAFLHLRPADLWKGDVAAGLRKQFPREAPDLLNNSERFFGVRLDDMESATLVASTTLSMRNFFGTRKVMPKKDFDFKDKGFDFKDKDFKDKDKDFDFKDKDFKGKDKDREIDFKDKKDFAFKDKDFKDKDIDFKDKDFKFKDKDFEFKKNFGNDESWKSDAEFMLDEAALKIITTTKPYNQDRVKRAILGPGEVKNWTHQKSGKQFWVTRQSYPWALHFVNQRTFVVVTPPAHLMQILDRPAVNQFQGPLAPALQWATADRSMVIGINATVKSAVEMRKQLAMELHEPRNELPTWALLPMLDVQSAAIAFDVATKTKAEGKVIFPNVQRAAYGEDGVYDALAFLRLFVLARAKHFLRVDGMDADDPTNFIFGALMMQQLERGLRAADIKRDGTTVSLQTSFGLDIEAVAALAKIEAQSQGKDDVAQFLRRQRTCLNNFKMIMLATQAFHDVNRHVPPPAVLDKKTGKPLLSWRVLILPYIDEQALYVQFKLDEPWDSPHNIKLLEHMPKVYAPVGVKTKMPHTTFVQALVGKDTCFPTLLNKDSPFGAVSLTLLGITDGTSNTIGVVEAFEPVPWTKPADLEYDAKKPLPRMGGGQFESGFHSGFMDGTVRWVSKNVDEKTLRAFITARGGEPTDFDRLERD